MSGSVNNQITPDGVLEITGGLLKIEGNNQQNGVHFVAGDGTSTKAATIVDNKPGHLIVIIPTLTAGQYMLQVSSQYNGGGLGLKAPRTGTFNKPLTVA